MAKVLISVVSLFTYFLLISSNSEPQREEILFEKVDKNLDGYLTKAELDSVFLLFDINHNNVVDKPEFDKDWTTTYQIGTQKEADLLFDHADANDDGIIDQKDLPNIFHFFDTNSDGKVSIDEFLTQWGSLTLMASGTNHTHTTPPPRHTTTMV